MLITQIKTVHEEEYSSEGQYSDKGRIIGILLNYSIENNGFEESFVYIFRENVYIFFNTIIEMLDYLMYSNKNVKRAYMEESEFDLYYDDNINGKFTEKLKWQ